MSCAALRQSEGAALHMRAIVKSASIRAALAGMPILRACEDAVLDVPPHRARQHARNLLAASVVSQQVARDGGGSGGESAQRTRRHSPPPVL